MGRYLLLSRRRHSTFLWLQKNIKHLSRAQRGLENGIACGGLERRKSLPLPWQNPRKVLVSLDLWISTCKLRQKTCLSELKFENLTESFESCITTINHHHTTFFWCVILAKTNLLAQVLPSPWRGWSRWRYVGCLQKGHVDRFGILLSIRDQTHEGLKCEFWSLRDGFFGCEFWGIVFRGFKISGGKDFVGEQKRCHNAWLSMISSIFF